MVLVFMVITFIALCFLCLKVDHVKNKHDSNSRAEPVDDDESYF